MSINDYSPSGGLIIGADNQAHNIVDLLGGGTPVSDTPYDINQFAPRGGLVVGSDNKLYDLTQLLQILSTKVSESLPDDGVVGRVYTTKDGVFLCTADGYELIAGNAAQQYGVYWGGGSSPTLTRLGSAVGLTANAQVGTTPVANNFDRLSPWADIFLCNMDNDGNIVAKYGDPAFSFAGSVAPYTYKLPVMVAIPKFYYKVVFRSPGREVWISPYSGAGFTLHPAFLDASGEEITDDYIYIGSELGAVETVETIDMLTSNTGENPLCLVSRATFRQKARGRGDGWELTDLPAWSALQMLFMVEYATLNSQGALGSGITAMPYSDTHVASQITTAGNVFTCLNAIAANYAVGDVINIGTTLGNINVAQYRAITDITADGNGTETHITFDGATVDIAIGNIIWCGAQPSGKCDTLGEKSGRAAGTDARSQVSYRGVKGFHGNAYTTIDGVNINARVWYMALDPADWDDASIASEDGYEDIGTCGDTNGYLTNFVFSEDAPWAFLPGAVGGGSTTYIPDYYYQNTGAYAPRVGGSAYSGTSAGAWCWNASSAASYAYWYFCGRLRYKKPN